MEFLDAIREQFIQALERRVETRMSVSREVTVRIIARRTVAQEAQPFSTGACLEGGFATTSL